jgi:hypothetical protein
MKLKILTLSCVAVGLLACPPAPIDMPKDDAGTMEPVEFTGEATGNPPDFSGDIVDSGQGVFDAGTAVVETRCCKLNFRIAANGEPASAVGKLMGEAAPLSAGIPLTRDASGFSAAACFLVNTSSYYWYEFSWFTSDADAGGETEGDGGYVVRTKRHSAAETNYPQGDGTFKNFIPAVNNCALLDAGTGP